MLKILSYIKFLCWIGCVIRGHGDESDGNFHQLFLLRGEDDPKGIIIVFVNVPYVFFF